jgi:excisionase family DNA binding protein
MLTVPEAARRVGRNPETIRRWIRSGKLPSRKVGTQHLIEEGDLEALLEPDLLPAPPDWDVMWDGRRMPDWEAIVRRQRASR